MFVPVLQVVTLNVDNGSGDDHGKCVFDVVEPQCKQVQGHGTS